MKFVLFGFMTVLLSACSSTHETHNLDINVEQTSEHLDVECKLDGPMRLHLSQINLVRRCNDAVYGYLVAANLDLSESDMKAFFSNGYEVSATYAAELSNLESFSRAEFSYHRKVNIAPTPTDGS